MDQGATIPVLDNYRVFYLRHHCFILVQEMLISTLMDAMPTGSRSNYDTRIQTAISPIARKRYIIIICVVKEKFQIKQITLTFSWE